MTQKQEHSLRTCWILGFLLSSSLVHRFSLICELKTHNRVFKLDPNAQVCIQDQFNPGSPWRRLSMRICFPRRILSKLWLHWIHVCHFCWELLYPSNLLRNKPRSVCMGCLLSQLILHFCRTQGHFTVQKKTKRKPRAAKIIITNGQISRVL